MRLVSIPGYDLKFYDLLYAQIDVILFYKISQIVGNTCGMFGLAKSLRS